MSEENGNPEISKLKAAPKMIATAQRNPAKSRRQHPQSSRGTSRSTFILPRRVLTRSLSSQLSLRRTERSRSRTITGQGSTSGSTCMTKPAGITFFPPQPQVREACWSKIGSTCPSSPVWDVLDPRRVENGGTTLVVYNDDPSPAGRVPLRSKGDERRRFDILSARPGGRRPEWSKKLM